MKVHPLLYPGAMIDAENPELGRQIEDEISMIQSYFDELVVLCSLFEEAKLEEERLFAAAMEAPQREQASNAVDNEFQEVIARAIENPANAAEILSAWHKTCVERQLLRWAKGGTPRAYMARRPIMYARAFVFTLSTIVQLVEQLARKTETPDGAKSAGERLRAVLPGLKSVRDSSAHVDERLAGRTRSRPIIPAALDNALASAPAGSFMLVESLIGDELVSTGADGAHVAVAVSGATVSEVRTVLQEIIFAFKWVGLVRVHPEW